MGRLDTFLDCYMLLSVGDIFLNLYFVKVGLNEGEFRGSARRKFARNWKDCVGRSNDESIAQKLMLLAD